MISQKQIIEFAKKNGFVVTGRKLRYWSANGLIPVSKMKVLGRGKGSESSYPDETEKQVVAICKQLAQKRSLVEVSWSLWRSGVSASPEVAKGVLHEALESLKDFVAKIQDKESGGVSDYAYDTFISPDALDPSIPLEDAEAAPQRHGRKEFYQPHGVLRGISKKLGAKRRFPTLKYLISLVYVLPAETYDYDPKFRSEDRKVNKEVFSAALGEFLPPGMLAPVIDPYPLLAEIRKLVDPAHLEECLREAGDATLRTAYQEIDSAYDFLWKVYYMLKVLFEGKPPRKNIEFEKLPADEQALWLLFWLSLRGNDGLYQGYKELSKGVSELLEAQLPAEEPFI